MHVENKLRALRAATVARVFLVADVNGGLGVGAEGFGHCVDCVKMICGCRSRGGWGTNVGAEKELEASRREKNKHAEKVRKDG